MDLIHRPHFGVTFPVTQRTIGYILVSHGKERSMSNPKNYRTLTEWQSLITEARTSGMTDSQWCLVNGISRNTFNNAIKRLRRKACDLPAPLRKRPNDILDLTAPKQEVVQVDIVPDVGRPGELIPKDNSFLDNSHMIEITFGDCKVSLCNGADPVLV